MAGLICCPFLLNIAGCSTLSESGPAHRTIESQASASLPNDANVFEYALVDITKDILAYVSDPGPGSFFHTFGTGAGPRPAIRVGVGDTVQVTLFEGQAGGLFIPTDAGSRPGNFVSLPNQTVDSTGKITVPYAGQISALNRSTLEIQQDIINRLKDKAIQPQAVVSVVSQTSTQVTVVGDVTTAGKIAVNPAGDRVLDAIARAGGIKYPGYETYVTLQRHGLKGTVYFLSLVKDPRENVFVSPGDTLYVSQYQRSFTAFGAVGSSAVNGAVVSTQYKFLQEKLTLNDAVGRAGGLLDNRSDPAQIFIYRIENRRALEKMGADLSHFHSEKTEVPTVFRVNYRDPSGFFVAQKFPMRDGDILYIDNADQIELTKFLNLVTQVPAAAANITSSVKIIGTP